MATAPCTLEKSIHFDGACEYYGICVLSMVIEVKNLFIIICHCREQVSSRASAHIPKGKEGCVREGKWGRITELDNQQVQHTEATGGAAGVAGHGCCLEREETTGSSTV